MKKESAPGAVADAFRELRKTAHWRQEDLAERIYVSRETVSRWERGCHEPDHRQRVLLLERLADLPEDARAPLADALRVRVTAPAAKTRRRPVDPAALAGVLRAVAEELDVSPRMVRRTVAVALRHVEEAGMDWEDVVEALRSTTSRSPRAPSPT